MKIIECTKLTNRANDKKRIPCLFIFKLIYLVDYAPSSLITSPAFCIPRGPLSITGIDVQLRF